MRIMSKKWLHIIVLCLFGSFFTLAQETTNATTTAYDPIEPINRFFWGFNYNILDPFVLSPLAHAYKAIIPRELRYGVSNVLHNLREPGNAFNNFLVGHWQDGFSSLARFGLNTTIGLFGLFDIATRANIPEKKRRFSRVLSDYHVGSGPYLVLPFLGSSTPRNLTGMFVENFYFPFYQMSSDEELIYMVTNIVDRRVQFIDQEDLLYNALDPYALMRSIYWQSIQYDTQSIKPPSEENIPEEFLSEIE